MKYTDCFYYLEWGTHRLVEIDLWYEWGKEEKNVELDLSRRSKENSIVDGKILKILK